MYMGLQKKQISPKVKSVYTQIKVEAKQETERLIATRNKKLQDFKKGWEPLS